MTSTSVKLLPDKDFPPLLKEIPDPPKKLFIRGALPDWQHKFLCVVGSRKYSSYGKEVCERLIAGLAGLPVTIVSGLALGIDAIAHRSALDSGLNTLAVPGSGLDNSVLYPRTHLGLTEEILASGGALLSEFEPKFRATVWSFPQRNRIMAGLSHAVLVIEAEIKSGTLITSRLATEYNREVLTVPGSVFSPGSAGPHMLIRLGATPITSTNDLRDALGFKTDDNSAEKNYDDCTDEEKNILGLLNEPMSRDELVHRSKLAVSQANALISMLEIKGHIAETGGEIRLT
jgi:DNA processing protein